MVVIIRKIIRIFISQYSFNKSILKYIYKNSDTTTIRNILIDSNNDRKKLDKIYVDTKEYIFWEFYKNSEEDKIYKILEEYFNAIKYSFEDKWCNPSSILCKTSGYSAFMKLFKDFYTNKNFTHLNGKAVFDLEIYKIGKNLYFKHKNRLFVNRSNLESSSYYIPGYVESENLFFPVNSKEKFLGSNIELVVNDFGYNKFNLVFDLKYDKAQNLIGNCINSDYCVVEGVE